MIEGSGRQQQRLDRIWPRSRPAVMGILNCTPDSFSDGGRYERVDDAISHAERLLDDGACIIDIGGESTRPGAGSVSVDEEMRRVLPVISQLRERRPEAVLSVDTTKIEVANAAFEAGADIVNDVSAAADPAMLELVAAAGGGIVLMHMRGEPRTMQRDTSYTDVIAEVHAFLRQRARAAVSAGIPAERVWLDPGIGFGKDNDGNLALLAALPDLATFGHPVVAGASNKSFIGRLTGAPLDERLPGSLASLVMTPSIPRVVVRVHSVAPTVQFLDVAAAVYEASA